MFPIDLFFYLIVGSVVSGGLAYSFKDTYRDSLIIVSFFSGVVSVAASGAIVFFAYAWFAAEHKAELINRQLGTNYTQEDMFFASGYIEEVREMQRKRIELNGDLIRESK